jgi:hypothetical protein
MGGAIGGGTSNDGKGRAICEGNTGEADDGRIEGGEVATETCSDAAGMVGAKGGYGAGDDGLGGEDEGVVCVDGVDKLGADWLANAHWETIFNLNRERCSCGQANGRCLTESGDWNQQDRHKQ